MPKPGSPETPKYVIRARLDREGKLYQERFRIAYFNKEVLYLITPGSERLTTLPRWVVFDELPVALVMEKFKTDDPSSRVYYWNPVPREHLAGLEIAFRSTVLAEQVRWTGLKLRNARETAESAKRQLEDAERKSADASAAYDREKAVWLAGLEEQAARINAAVLDGKIIQSEFIHPGRHEYDETLRTLDRATATVLSAAVPEDPEKYGYALRCSVMFDERPKLRFDVHGYTIPGLYGWLVETDTKKERT